jgi:Fic family protein
MLFTPAKLDKADHRVLDLIRNQHQRLRPLVAAPRRWSGILRKVALARAVRGSNSIEGYRVSVDDAIAALDDQEPMTADELSWHAVRGYRDAMTYVLQIALEERPNITAETLKALHFMMQHYDLTSWPGRWRPGEVYVYDEDNRTTVYIGPAADEVPGLIDELVKDINSTDPDLPAMVRAAMAHLNLVMIHPFKDGNGRMARCLQTLILACDGTLMAPEFSSIEEYLGHNQQAYYRVLAKVGGGSWNPGGDTRPWIRFCLTAHHRQARRVEVRAELASRLWIQAEDAVAKARLPERCVQPLTFCLSGRVLRNATYRQLTEGLSHNVAGRDLVELTKAGLLEPKGEKRGRYYVPALPLRELADRIGAEVGQRFAVEGDPYD